MSEAEIKNLPPCPGPKAAAPVPSPRVHPMARQLAGLLSPMALQDQKLAAWLCNTLMILSVAISFPVAYWMQNILVCIYSVTAAALCCLVVCLPNWWQRRDPDLKFADDQAVWRYYKELRKVRGVKDPDEENEGKAD